MAREQELVDRDDARDLVTAIDEDAKVARQGSRVARHRHEPLHLRLGQLLSLRGGTRARRIEDHGVVRLELLPAERIAEEVAPVRADRLQLGRMPRGIDESCQCRGAFLIGIDGRALGLGLRDRVRLGLQAGRRA